MGSSNIELRLQGDFEISIGSAEENDVRLDGLKDRQAILRRKGGRLFLKSLVLSSDAWLNGNALRPGAWQEVTRYDEILLSEVFLQLSPKFFLGADRVGVDTTRLYLKFPLEKDLWLCEGAYLRAQPGSMTGIMGPAGCGKTVLLNLLAGYLRPDDGLVTIGNNFEPNRDLEVLRDFVGYVPQGDVLFSDLTVQQSLDYRLQLKFPDMEKGVRNRLIVNTCGQLGFEGERAARFLHTLIGSAEGGRRGLSGGERKRANIAHELIARPVLLFLDEPTTGLSSSDSDRIVELLRGFSRDELITVAATIHQPSRFSFARFDQILALTYGGRIAYYGPTDGIVDYFERATGSRCQSSNPAEYVMDAVSDPATAQELSRSFQEEPPARSPLPLPQNAQPAEQADQRPGFTLQLGRDISRMLSLSARNLAVLFSDRTNLLLNLLQAPIIALLILVAFQSLGGDTREVDQFAATIYFFDLAKAPVEERRDTVEVDALFETAKQQAERTHNVFSPAAGRLRASIYFILIASSIWFGTLGGCREIVSEREILRREVRSCTGFGPYLSSKVLVQALLRGVQTGILTLLCGPVLLQLPLGGTIQLWGILWLVSLTSACLGLLISALAASSAVALTAVPLVIIPQLLFGGLLRPLSQIPADATWTRAAAMLNLQRWGFQSSLHVDSPSGRIALEQGSISEFSGPYWEMNIVTFQETTLADFFFSEGGMLSGALSPLLFLTLFSLFFVGLAYVVMRRRFLTVR